MGKCHTQIDEVRFDTRDPDLTHVYVAISVSGDCPIGVQGWHHKVFPARISAIEIYQKHFADFLEWGQEAPPDYARANNA